MSRASAAGALLACVLLPSAAGADVWDSDRERRAYRAPLPNELRPEAYGRMLDDDRREVGGAAAGLGFVVAAAGLALAYLVRKRKP